MIRRLVQWAVLLICASGCSIDDTDLATAAKAFHSKSSWTMQIHQLLDKPSQLHCSTTDLFKYRLDSSEELEDLKVLRETKLPDLTIAWVQGTYLDPKRGCRIRRTHGWTQEERHWRVQFFPRFQYQAERQYRSGGYAAALKTSEEWMALARHGFDGRHAYLEARERVGTIQNGEGPLAALLIPRMLEIAPEDDTALLDAVSHSGSAESAMRFFKKLPVDSCLRDSAALGVEERLPSPTAKLAFLDEANLNGPTFATARAVALNDLSRGAEAMELIKEHGRAINDLLQTRGDPAWSAKQAVRAATVAGQNKDESESRRWLEAATAFDPHSPSAADLDKRLHSPCCDKLTARFGSASRLYLSAAMGWGAEATLENVSPVPFKHYRVRARAYSAQGLVVHEALSEGANLASGATGSLRFDFMSETKVRPVEVKLELLSVSVEGVEQGDASFWVTIAPPVKIEEKESGQP